MPRGPRDPQPLYTARVSLRFKSRILDHLAHRNYLPIYINEVARQLRVADEDEAEFLETVRELGEAGLLEIGKDEKLRLPRLPEEIEGVIKPVSYTHLTLPTKA